jgi:hypothetical protein
MDATLPIAIARATERGLAVLAGILAIWIGYKLFLALPTRREGESKLDLPGGISVAFSRIGPGSLFALFGAGMIAYCVSQPVSFEQSVSATGERKSSLNGLSEASTGASDEVCAEPCVQVKDAMKSLTAFSETAEENQRKIITEAKLRIMTLIWDEKKFGSLDAFRNWIKASPRPDAPLGMKHAADIFDGAK